jgi:hypothetical protein
LLPLSHEFLSSSWQRCAGGLSGHSLYEECVQTKIAGNNDWMQLLQIGEFSEKKNARQKEGCGKRYAVTNSNFLEIAAVNRSDDSSTFRFVFLLVFSLSCFVAASMVHFHSTSKFRVE